jgi:Na+-transporting methylmalonyl-CoA/oxaloacetate decarboxylase gamma subunit
MNNLDFGVTMTVLGMGGTLLILFLISLIVEGVNKYLIHSSKKAEARKEA